MEAFKKGVRLVAIISYDMLFNVIPEVAQELIERSKTRDYRVDDNIMSKNFVEYDTVLGDNQNIKKELNNIIKDENFWKYVKFNKAGLDIVDGLLGMDWEIIFIIPTDYKKTYGFDQIIKNRIENIYNGRNYSIISYSGSSHAYIRGDVIVSSDISVNHSWKEYTVDRTDEFVMSFVINKPWNRIPETEEEEINRSAYGFERIYENNIYYVFYRIGLNTK